MGNYEALYARLHDENGREMGRETREETAKIARQRSSVRNTTSANNGYIAWAERLLLANDGNFFRGYVYPSPDDGLFRRQERGFPVARRAINDITYFSKNRGNNGRQNPTVPRSNESMDRKRLSHARLERLHD